MAEGASGYPLLPGLLCLYHCSDRHLLGKEWRERRRGAGG